VKWLIKLEPNVSFATLFVQACLL